MSRRFHRAPHQVMRYAPVLRNLRRLAPGAKVLEVGSGSEGIGTWWDRPFVGLDLEFTTELSDGLRALRGDATRLPFPDLTFDLVVCVGVLHFLEGSLEAALHEIGRVSRGLAVVCAPCRPEAVDSDRRNLAWCRRWRILPPPWFLEQIRRGLPAAETFRNVLAEYGYIEEGATLSVPWNERLFRMEQLMRLIPGAMTVAQPGIRLWGRISPLELPRGGPPYERSFVLDAGARVSPPRSAS